MRLLNIESFKLESYDNENVIPPYLVLSHKWGEDEISFQDLQELPQDIEIRELRQSLRNVEQRFERVERFLNTEWGTVTQAKGESPQLGRHTDSTPGVEKEGDEMAVLIQSLPHLNRAKQKETSWNKIYGCCKEAKALGFSYVWVDTCCINKDSSSELSEAINSMFSWYRNATVCIAYLSDVSFENRIDEFLDSKWFTRGWTLQELIAPDDVWFYSQDWQFLGLRSAMASLITTITSISDDVLHQKSQYRIHGFSAADRLSWAAKRVCTRPEDRSYSLLGLFGVNMPAIYGEGERAAFFRLQFEIFKVVPDHSIFAWKGAELGLKDANMFAPSVGYFQGAPCIVSMEGSVHSLRLPAQPALQHARWGHGIRVWLLVRRHLDHFQACLGCMFEKSGNPMTIFVNEINEGNFSRRPGVIQEVEWSMLHEKEWFMKEAFISYPKTDSTVGNFRSMWVGQGRRLHVNDEQVLASRFKRVGFPSDSPTKVHIPGVHLNTRTTRFFSALAGFTDLSAKSMLISWKDERGLINATVYLNKDTMALFALLIKPESHGKARVAIIDPFNPDIDAKHVTTEISSKTLASGWHVFLYCSNPPGDRSHLHLSAMPVNSLESGVRSS